VNRRLVGIGAVIRRKFDQLLERLSCPQVAIGGECVSGAKWLLLAFISVMLPTIHS
jgi:hypothetical protein